MTPAAGATASPWASSGSAKGRVVLSPSGAAGTGQQVQGLRHPSSSSHRVPKDFCLEEEWNDLTGLGDGDAAVGPQRCSATLLSGKKTFLSMCLQRRRASFMSAPVPSVAKVLSGC